MVVAPGTRLGPYEVVAPLGAGGMGEVYRARDTRLGRDVAIKVLASEVANDPERRARFEREARAVAALDHAHICGIYDVGEANGIHYLVMPLLEGQTLEARLAKGPLPLDQALAIARQIADALDEAHRQGIVHRDLKPANVILTKVGTGSGGTPQAKLLDFGLAKLRAPGSPVTLSATGTAATAATGTAEGTILGTLHYMAPEQVEGKDADARSDIWALGAVLYEMVSGVRPFEGDTAASLIGAILKDRPLALASRDPLTPAALDDLVAGCLEKSPDDRWQHIGDIRRLLQVVTRTSVDAAPPARRPYGFALGLGAAFVSAIVIVAALLIRGPATDTPSAVSEPVTFTVTPPPGLQFVGSPGSVPIPQFAVSPDGRQLVYVASGLRGRASLWLRTLTEAEAKPLIGTDDAESPFWAPDSRTIGFAAQGALKRKDISSAAPAEVITSTPADGRGAAWSDDGRIVIAPTGTSVCG
ncbi:MAG: protein kinase [Gemmatimonadaceae bacterium]